MKDSKVNFSNESWTIGHLMDEFRNGSIQIPEIQRDVVWKADKVKNLIDSINSKYPCGSLILWEPRLKDERLLRSLIRPERLSEIKRKKLDLPKYFIIDGQQRLTALVAALLEPGFLKRVEPNINLDWEYLFINIKQLPKIEIEASFDDSDYSFPWFQINKVYDNSVLDNADFKQLNSDKQNKVRTFRDKIRDYLFPVQIIKECEYHLVANIFYRVNTLGSELTTAEIHIAQIVPYWRGITKEFRSFLNEHEKKYYSFGLTFLIKCLTVIATNSAKIVVFSKKVQAGEFKKKELNRIWRDCKNSINKVVDIIREESPLENSKFLTSQNIFIPPIYYFYKSKKEKRRINKKDVLKFFYYAQLGNHYEAHTETVLKKDLQEISSAEHVTDGMRKLCNRIKDEARSEYRGLNVAHDRVRGSLSRHELLLFIYLAMCRKDAMDFVMIDPALIKNIPPNDVHLHHIFPVEFMMSDEILNQYVPEKMARSDYKELVDDIANITFISKSENSSIGSQSPQQYLETVCSKDNLKAHFIPLDKSLWKPQNFEKFLKERRIFISKAITKLIKSF